MNTFYLIIFSIGVIWSVKDRILFEKNKKDKSNEYITLYRENSNLRIVIFIVLVIDKISNIL